MVSLYDQARTNIRLSCRVLSGRVCLSACGSLCYLPSSAAAAFTNPADHFMDLITVRNPVRSSAACPPVSLNDLMPDPEQLKAFYKNMEVLTHD